MISEHIKFKLPEEATVVVLCCNKGYGLEPIKVLLPHQIYKEDLQKYKKESPDIESFTILPVNHKEYIEIKEEKWKK